jgi:hypothetical protein
MGQLCLAPEGQFLLAVRGLVVLEDRDQTIERRVVHPTADAAATGLQGAGLMIGRVTQVVAQAARGATEQIGELGLR